jgi:hypothetical protein
MMLKNNKEKFELPQKDYWWSTHLDNLNYCIDKLRREPSSVMGYYVFNGFGTVERYHQIIAREDAEKASKQFNEFRTVTLDDLLARKNLVTTDKNYKIEKDGKILFLPAHN